MATVDPTKPQAQNMVGAKSPTPIVAVYLRPDEIEEIRQINDETGKLKTVRYKAEIGLGIKSTK